MTTITIQTPSNTEWDHNDTHSRIEGTACALDQQLEILVDGKMRLTSCETGSDISLEAALLFIKDYNKEGFDWPILFTPDR